MRHEAVTLWPALALLALGACNTTHTVSFRRDIHPVLEAYCLECHSPPSGKGYLASGLDLHSHASLMRGSIYGAVVTPGNSRTSILAMLVEGRAAPSQRMPHNAAEPLPPGDIENLRRWIDQGAVDN